MQYLFEREQYKDFNDFERENYEDFNEVIDLLIIFGFVFLEKWVQQVFYALSFEHRMYICMWGCLVNADELFSKQLFTEQRLVPPILRACVHMYSRT